MSFPTISKSIAPQFNFDNYSRVVKDFDWSDAWNNVSGNPDNINICYEAVDRHIKQGHGDRTAIRFMDKKGQCHNLSYTGLYEQTNQFANLLSGFNLPEGSVVFGLAGRVRQLYVALLGSLKAGAVFSPLFSAFGPEPVHARMEIGQARVLITTERLYRKKVAPWRDQLPSLRYVLLFDIKGECPPGCLDLDQLLSEQSVQYQVVPTHGEQMALLHFTSGTTGKPKAAVHVHSAVVYHKHSAFYALDLRPGDIYWCTADPGWVTGTSYGVIAPLCHGVTLLIDEGEFDPQRWYQVLQDQKVNVWYTAPTAIRMLMKAGDKLPGQYDLSTLRFMASVGEPLNPEAVVWSTRIFGQPFHDNWWQSETGGIMIANFATMDVKPGSMGRPLPGIQACIMVRDSDGPLKPSTTPGEVGELAIKSGWPSMFRNYLHEHDRYKQSFQGLWYLTGDQAMVDADGYYWFVGRSNDLIKSSGHLIGPFEVESSLVEHAAVAEAAVIGVPDEIAGERVKAFVALNPGFEFNAQLQSDLMAHARIRLGPAVAPREIEVRDNLPKTRSGKIMRRLLKARELGLPEGDISTLESDEHGITEADHETAHQ